MASTKQITTPDLGGATDVTVIEVLVKPGDKVAVDAPLVTLESDKATMEIPTTDAGVIKEIKVKVGDKISSGSVLVTLETTGASVAAEKPAEKIAAPAEKQAAKSADVKSTSAPQPKPASPPATQVLTGTVQTNNDVHAGPGVRRMARELGVNLTQVAGSGPKQRIVKEDVQVFVKSQLSQIQSGAGMQLPARN